MNKEKQTNKTCRKAEIPQTDKSYGLREKFRNDIKNGEYVTQFKLVDDMAFTFNMPGKFTHNRINNF